MAGIKGQPTPKPQDIQSPVPNQNEAPSFEEFAESAPSFEEFSMGEAGAAETAGAGQQAQEIIPPSLTEQAMSAGGQMLSTAGQVLDYPGGIVRTAVAQGAEALDDALGGAAAAKSGEQIVTSADWKAAFKGKAPGMAEYLKRMGVPEGGSLGGVSLRGATGFLADMAFDPFTVIAKTVKQMPYLRTLINSDRAGAANRASEALGEAIYKSTVSAADEKLAKAASKRMLGKSKAPIGDALVEAGAPVGGEAALRQHVENISNTMGKMRQSLYDRFTELGGKVDVTDSTFNNARAVLTKMRQNPTQRGLADELDNMLNAYKGEGFVPIEVMSNWKTELYDSLPKGAYTGLKLSSPAKRFKAALALDFKKAIVDSGNKVERGLGDTVEQLNSKWGALLDGPKYMSMGPGANTLGRRIEAAVVAGSAAVGGPMGALKAAAANKAYNIATGTRARTLVGRAFMEAGKQDVASRLARQALVTSERQMAPQAPVIEPEE